jgi:uncharacterized membrane protein YqiK
MMMMMIMMIMMILMMMMMIIIITILLILLLIIIIIRVTFYCVFSICSSVEAVEFSQINFFLKKFQSYNCFRVLICPRSRLPDAKKDEASNRTKRGIMRRIPLLIACRVACRWAK